MSRGDRIAERIDKRLKWLEKNDNPLRTDQRGMETHNFYYPSSYRAGAKIMVSYIRYQGRISLTFDEAERYADYLDDGGAKSHNALHG